MSGRTPLPRGRLRLLKVTGWRGRLRGLLCRPPPGPRSGILLAPCAAVHTFGMRHAIDVAFVSADGKVMEMRRALAPWRVALSLGAVAVVEMRAGVIDAEYGGIGGIEAAIQHATRGDVERDLQRARELRGQADGHQQLIHKGASHLTATPRITIDGDTAEAVAYSFVVLRNDKDWGVWRASANRWTLRRTPQGWRIVERFNRVLDGSEASHAILRQGTIAP